MSCARNWAVRVHCMSRAGDPIVDYETRSVSCSAGEGLPTRLAVFREGYGTVLLPPGATLGYVKKLPQAEMPFPKGDPAKIAWPAGDLLPQKSLPPEVSKAELERALEAAFSAKKHQLSKTLGVVVVIKAGSSPNVMRPAGACTRSIEAGPPPRASPAR